MKPLRTRLEALEFDTGTGRNPRELSDEQLDAELKFLAARIDPGDLSPADRERLRTILKPGDTGA
jgi:hypothetical protein